MKVKEQTRKSLGILFICVAVTILTAITFLCISFSSLHTLQVEYNAVQVEQDVMGIAGKASVVETNSDAILSRLRELEIRMVIENPKAVNGVHKTELHGKLYSKELDNRKLSHASIGPDGTSNMEPPQTASQASSDWLPYSVGRVLIPQFGVDFKLENAFEVNQSPQTIVDKGYAAGFLSGDIYVVCAHQNLGFAAMRGSVPEETYAYIDGVRYLCSRNYQGINNGNELLNADGSPLTGSGTLMYTCNGADSYHITFTSWEPV